MQYPVRPTRFIYSPFLRLRPFAISCWIGIMIIHDFPSPDYCHCFTNTRKWGIPEALRWLRCTDCCLHNGQTGPKDYPVLLTAQKSQTAQPESINKSMLCRAQVDQWKARHWIFLINKILKMHMWKTVCLEQVNVSLQNTHIFLHINWLIWTNDTNI